MIDDICSYNLPKAEQLLFPLFFFFFFFPVAFLEVNFQKVLSLWFPIAHGINLYQCQMMIPLLHTTHHLLLLLLLLILRCICLSNLVVLLYIWICHAYFLITPSMVSRITNSCSGKKSHILNMHKWISNSRSFVAFLKMFFYPHVIWHYLLCLFLKYLLGQNILHLWLRLCRILYFIIIQGKQDV